MHQALYRKYRPRTFKEVCGQKHITDVLSYEVAQGRCSHAYLFCGSRGTGKTSCAKILAKALNCLSPEDGSPCLECDACREIDAGLATDVTELDAASNNGVDQIRSICEEAAYTPAVLRKKVYIIDEVHMLSQGAFNALLKTIEEPPEHVVFILATTELNKVPATIVSRCQRFDFRRLSIRDISARLEYIAERENISLEKDAALLLARQAQGGMRDAIGLFELCAAGGADVTAARVSELLGLSGYDRATRTFDCVKRGDMAGLFAVVSEVYGGSQDISVFWQELISFARDMLVCKYSEDISAYLDITDTETEMLRSCAEKFSLAELIYHCRVLDEAMARMQRSPQNKRCTAELALLRMCRPELDNSTEALSARIAKLEDAAALGTFSAPAAAVPAAEGAKTYADTVSAGGSPTVSPAASPAADNHYSVPENPSPAAAEDADFDASLRAQIPASEAENVQENAERNKAEKSDINISESSPARPAQTVSAERENKAPYGAGSSEYVPASDISEVLAKLDGVNRGLSEFLADSAVSVSKDGKRVRIFANGFGVAMLSTDAAKASLADAFALAKLTNGRADISVEKAMTNAAQSSSPADELSDML